MVYSLVSLLKITSVHPHPHELEVSILFPSFHIGQAFRSPFHSSHSANFMVPHQQNVYPISLIKPFPCLSLSYILRFLCRRIPPSFHLRVFCTLLKPRRNTSFIWVYTKSFGLPLRKYARRSYWVPPPHRSR